ncbi:MAG: hypothetical protein J6T09_05665 [Bacteroidales bacterium]|nr:hypothetical protein [Bacteroidales bacterium]MBO7585138.1 hypothetical protein [Bacteroidales bacterium]
MENIVYQDSNYTLGERDGLAWLEVDGTSLKLTSQPYEPCLYITRPDGGVTTIHNAFDASVVMSLFADGRTLSSITGRVYRPGDFCGMVWHTVNKWGPQEVQIDAAEQSYIEVLKKAPLRFPPIGQGSICLQKAKTLADGVVIGELPLDLIRFIYVIRLQGPAQADFSAFGQLSEEDYHKLRHYNDIRDWDPLEGDISQKRKPLEWADYKAFASKHSLCGGLAGNEDSFGPQDLVKILVYSRE